MNLLWSLKQIPELSGLSWQKRHLVLKRFLAILLGQPVNRWSAASVLVVPAGLIGGAIATNFLPEILGACALVMGAIGAFYLHHLILLNLLAHSLRRRDVEMLLVPGVSDKTLVATNHGA